MSTLATANEMPHCNAVLADNAWKIYLQNYTALIKFIGEFMHGYKNTAILATTMNYVCLHQP